MLTPQNHSKQYQTLYHAFTCEYSLVNNLVNQFYPVVKRFVQSTGPELDLYMQKLNGAKAENAPPAAYQAITGYLSAFDDFTLVTNKSLGELSAVLKRSEAFINRAMEVKWGTGKDELSNEYSVMMDELDELISSLEKAAADVSQLEKQMNKLIGQWKKAKERIQ